MIERVRTENAELLDRLSRWLGWAATRIFCLLNDRGLVFAVDDAEELVRSVARGEL